MRTVKNSFGRLGAILLSLALCLVMLPMTAFAAEPDAGDAVSSVAAEAEAAEDENEDEDEDENTGTTNTDTETDDTSDAPVTKELTVGSGEYTTIQKAIDYINEQDDKDGWTITVESGTYTYFTVNQTISNLTITGKTDATVDCSDGSIQLMGDTITLEGLTFTAKNTAWSVPVIKDCSSNAGLFYDSMVTIKNCAFEGDNAGCALWICRLNSTVQNCTFDGFNYAIEIINETSTAAKIDTGTTNGTITIDGNAVTNCDFFIHYGVRSGITLVVTNNVVTGSATEVCASLFAWEGESITVEGNTFTYAAFGLQNAINDVSAETFLDTNIFINSYVVDDYYNYTTKADYSATYYAPAFSGKTPVWSVSTTGVTGDMSTNFKNALKGRENENTLTFTTENGVGDLVCMGLAYQALNLDYEETYPDLKKTIVVTGEDGKETEVKQDDVAAGDTVTFKLTSNVSSSLTDYIDYTYSTSGIVGTVKENATYTLAFHDQMDEKMVLDEDPFTVYVGEKLLDSTYYTITTSDLSDGCTFEVSMDLLALYTDNLISESDFGTAEITVTYSATLSEDATAGTYKNTAWVVYQDGESEKDIAEVNTYGLSVFKYDQAPIYDANGELVCDENGDEAHTGLSGAKFSLYSDKSCEEEYLVDTMTSDADGYATLNGLDAGTYYLKETEAPSGYVMSNVTVEIVIPKDADKDSNIVSIDFANAAIPSTGGTGTTIYTVAGICIVLAAGLALIVTRKKRRAE